MINGIHYKNWASPGGGVVSRKGRSMNGIALVFLAGALLSALPAIGNTRDDIDPDTRYFAPSGAAKNVAIIFLGGSDGGLPNHDVERYTSMGYPCLKIGYFKTKSTPDHLEMIPLEYFEEVIKTFRSRPEIGDKKIVVYGGSKGGELALLLSSRCEQIEGVIAKVPSSVVFQGIGGPSSSWSYNGLPIPFVPYYKPYDYSKVTNNQWLELYELSITQTKMVAKAAIEVENINGPILLLSGTDDAMWPSTRMCEMIVIRLKANKFPHWYKHYAYEDAGHSLNDRGVFGGTIEGNRLARIDSNQRVMNFLKRVSEE